MKIITFLLSLALLSLGFAGGVAFITIFTKDTIKQLRLENRQLRSDMRLLKRQKKNSLPPKKPPDLPKRLALLRKHGWQKRPGCEKKRVWLSRPVWQKKLVWPRKPN